MKQCVEAIPKQLLQRKAEAEEFAPWCAHVIGEVVVLVRDDRRGHRLHGVTRREQNRDCNQHLARSRM